MASVEVVDLDAGKPLTDKKSYRCVVLNNGLRAVLIHDPVTAAATTDKPTPTDGAGPEGGSEEDSVSSEGGSEEEGEEEDGEEGGGVEEKPHTHLAALSMCVGVGSWSDPPEVQGLAHFAEHMLLGMGSAKYPKEGDFDEFLAAHGGDSNAHTEYEYTCYEVEVNPDALEEAQDRLAAFFHAPQWKDDATERELEAIESEAEGASTSDSARRAEVMCRTSKAGSPWQQFSWGNRQSLQTGPREAGVDVRAVLFDWVKQNYSPNRMHVAVRGPQSLDVLQGYVEASWGALEPRPEVPPLLSFASRGFPFDGPDLLHVKSLRDSHKLNLCWPVNSTLKQYRESPQDYLAHLVGHEGAGSVLAHLKSLGYATSLCAGEDEATTNCSLFSVEVGLSLKGLAAWQEVLVIVVQYLNMLRGEGPLRWVFDEMAALDHTRYHFGEETGPLDQCIDTATRLVYGMPNEDVLVCGVECTFAPELITEMLELLVPSRMRVELISSKFKVAGEDADPDSPWPVLETKEPHFGAFYHIQPLPSALLDTVSSAPPNPALFLPVPNPFVPTDLTVKPYAAPPSGTERKTDDEDGGRLDLLPPAALVSTPRSRLWFKQDQVFGLPHTAVRVFFHRRMDMSAKARILLELWAVVVGDLLNETLYAADLALLSGGAQVGSRYGVSISVIGFNHKLPVLLLDIVNTCTKLVRDADPDRFDMMKEAKQLAYRNALIRPGVYASYLRTRTLLHDVATNEEMLDALAATTLDDVKAFAEAELFSNVFVEMLIHGNETPEDAQRIHDSVLEALPAPAEVPAVEDMGFVRFIVIPSGTHLFQQAVATLESEPNTVVDTLYQLGKDDVELRTRASLLAHIMFDKAFDRLRTKEQLGYSVDCDSTGGTDGFMNYYFRIRSAKYSARHVFDRIQVFIEWFRDYLRDMPEADYDSFLSNFVETKLVPDTHMAEETGRHWNEIKARRYDYAYLVTEVEALRATSKADLVAFYDTHFTAATARRVTTWVRRAEPADDSPPPEGVTDVSDPEALAAIKARFDSFSRRKV